jgi:hypothetical protein
MAKKFAAWLWGNFNKIALLIGWAMSFGVPAWATWAMTALQVWAPLSWVVAGFSGMLVAAAIYAIVARARLWFVNAKAADEFYKQTDRINPLDNTFRNRRIRIADLAPPFEPVIKGKTFIDCELIGPANAGLTSTVPGALTITGAHLINCGACKVKNAVFISTGIMLEDCTIVRGKIFRVTFFIPEVGYEHMKNSMPGLNWLTPD